MSRQGLALLSARPRAAIAISGALVLVMAFAGTVLGHHTLPSATFACDGTVTWHVDDWTTDNTHNQALAPDIETWYSLDGGSYVKIGVFDFDQSNYLTGFGGSFSGGSATTVKIKANLQPGTTWADGATDSPGPWFSDATGRASCPSQAPSSAPSDGPSSAPSTAPRETPPTLTALCAPDAADYQWEVVVTADSTLALEYSFDGFETVAGTLNVGPDAALDSTFNTPRSSGDLLSVRFTANHASVAGPVAADGDLCATSSPSEAASASPTGGVGAATATPRITPPSTSTIDSPDGPTGSGFPMILAVLIGLALAVLIFTPRDVVSRARRLRR